MTTIGRNIKTETLINVDDYNRTKHQDRNTKTETLINVDHYNRTKHQDRNTDKCR